MKTGNVLLFGLCLQLATVTGCSAGADPERATDASEAVLNPVDEATIARLKLRDGVKVVGALPAITAEHQTAPGLSVQDTHVGGTGGSRYYWSDTSYLGIVGRAGNYVDRLGFHGANGDTIQEGGGGGSPRDIWCGGSLIVVGIFGGAGNYIDRLGPICGTPSTMGVANNYMGGPLGTAFNYRCPLNTWVVAWEQAAGNYNDALIVYCGTA
jgi:hypothetical protein